MRKPLSNYRLIAIAIWLLAVATSLTWNTLDDIREQEDIASITARALFEQIIASRQWNLMHNGVYVYTTENSPPNPYLPKESQTIRDADGRSLTLLSPSYMTRQLADISKKNGKVSFHLTSLTPLRPENAPYSWEVEWLESFARGSREQSSFVTEKGQNVFRYMAPLYFSESCSSCHLPEDQPDGNIRGAISISMPIPCRTPRWPLLLSHLLIAATGIAAVLFFGDRLAISRRSLIAANRQLAKEIEKHKQTEKELISTQENLENIVDNRTTELRTTNAMLDSKIQEQLRIESSLVAINDEFIQIFNSAPDGMQVIDRAFNVIRTNKAYCQLTQRSVEEIQGHKCYEVFTGKLCHTEKCPLTQIINGTERIEVEARKTRADGTAIPCIVTATPFRDPGGKLTGIIEVTRDISNWKEIEQSLSETAEHLRARNLELEDFAHVISHDLQEPLILIKAFSDRIRIKCATSLPQKAITYLERIESSTKRMQNLIDGLLLYSRVSSKAIPFEKVNLQEVIHSVLDDLAIRIEKNQAQIHVDPDLPVIEGDPLQIRQLFQNLIGNSLKYTDKSRRPKVNIKRIMFPDNYDNQRFVRLCIEDNGIGFKEEHKDIIFDIFQRLHTRKEFRGTGIGLSICKKIIERHRGTITATGFPGKGAQFTITFPRQQQELFNNKKPNNSCIDMVINRR